MLGTKRESPEDNEGKRLQAVSIRQDFSWTGLKKRLKKSPRPCGSNDDNFVMEGLVLWEVLGYALGDENDYRSFVLVNKEWRKMVKLLEPPVIFRMSALLSKTTDGPLLQYSDLALLSTVLEQCISDRQSALYRNGSSSTATTEWPLLQPQFNVVLMRFVYTVATQRNPHNYSRETYQLVCEFLTSLAEKTVHKLLDAFSVRATDNENGKDDSLVTFLEPLLSIWLSWEGIVDTVNGIAGYLNKYYVKHNNLPTIADYAKQSFARYAMQAIQTKEETSSFAVPSFRHLLNMLSSATRQQVIVQSPADRSLILRTWHAIDAVRSVPVPSAAAASSPWLVHLKDDYWRTHALLEPALLELTLARAAEEEEEEAEGATANNEGITIVLADGTRLSASHHFIQSSGFLRKLHLCPRDQIKLSMFERGIFEKALEFCNIGAPFTPIQTPLRSSNLYELVSEPYADFISSLEFKEVSDLVSFSNFMDLENLLDLSCLQISIAIKGRSAAELRELFRLG